jgi:hypothetical protein
MTIPYATELLFDEVAQCIDREDRRLQALENASSILINDAFDIDGIASMSRVLTYVVCGGLLERLMRDLPQVLVDDVISMRTSRGKLPLGLLAAIEGPTFRKCTEQTSTGVLARVELLLAVNQHANDTRPVEDFSQSLVLADGSSIGTKQFEAVWLALGLSGDWKNKNSDALLLRELKAKRNEVAHWENDPVDVGKSRTYSDLRQVLRQLRDLLDHLCLSVCAWLDGLASV